MRLGEAHPAAQRRALRPAGFGSPGASQRFASGTLLQPSRRAARAGCRSGSSAKWFFGAARLAPACAAIATQRNFKRHHGLRPRGRPTSARPKGSGRAELRLGPTLHCPFRLQPDSAGTRRFAWSSFGLELRSIPSPSASSRNAVQHHPGCCWQRSLARSFSEGPRGSGGEVSPRLAHPVPGRRLWIQPRWPRIFSITGRSRMAATIFSSPPQFGQCCRSNSKRSFSED